MQTGIYFLSPTIGIEFRAGNEVSQCLEKAHQSVMIFVLVSQCPILCVLIVFNRPFVRCLKYILFTNSAFSKEKPPRFSTHCENFANVRWQLYWIGTRIRAQASGGVFPGCKYPGLGVGVLKCSWLGVEKVLGLSVSIWMRDVITIRQQSWSWGGETS